MKLPLIEHNKRLPKQGQWVLIIDKIPCEISPPVFSIFFATPKFSVRDCDRHISNCFIQNTEDDTRSDYVEILTEEGTVCLAPHEYRPIDDIKKYLSICNGKDAEVCELSCKNSKKFDDIVFYCQSRGMNRVKALEIAMTNSRTKKAFWIKIHPAYAEYFGKIC